MADPVVMSHAGKTPRIHPSVYLAPGVVVIGDVEIGPDSSLWPGAILRGDMGEIRIGARTNIQDGSILHMSYGGPGTHVGDDVTVGHGVLLHDCQIEEWAFIGMRAVLLDGSRVKSYGMLAAGALLTSGKTVGAREIWAGNPAKLFRTIPDEESQILCSRAGEYAALAQSYRAG